MSEIIIKPIGGIGNRLYAIASAIELAKQTNRQLVVLWSLRWELNARFDDFWESDRFLVKYVDEFNSPWRYLNRFFNFQEFFLKFNKKVISDNDMYLIRDEIGDYNFTNYFLNLDNSKSLFIESCFDFIPDKSFKLKDVFVLTESIRNELEILLSGIPTKYSALHVRRTDHANAIDNSPDELFFDILRRDNEIYFLCTDDIETEIRYKKMFPGRIYTYSKIKERNSKLGIIEAVLDLYLLSMAKEINGSFNSTFSSLASEIGGVPLKIVKKIK
jgi:hypothetical protein